jgi:GTP-binding protein
VPQTRFVLQKALELGLKPIVVINKVDKPNCRPEEVQEEVFELMFNLEASEEQLNFPTIYGSAKNGWMSADLQNPGVDITPLLDCIVENIPAPDYLEGTPQMLITSLDYSSYVGRIAIGRVHRGKLRENMQVTLMKNDGTIKRNRIKELMVFEGLAKKKVSEVWSGEICALVGLENFDIGDTVADFENPEALESIKIDEPTMSMVFTINNSPFFGKEGKYVTSRHLKERLDKELEKNLALRVKPTDSFEAFTVFGRGVLHLSILIETMRREGYELQVGQPQVIIKNIGGEPCEPIEILSIDIPEEYSGKTIDLITQRKGVMTNMERKGDRLHLEFDIPSRGIIGLRNNILTATAGEAVLTHRFKAFEPHKGEIEKRQNGSLIAMETGNVYAYALDKLQDRGKYFIEPGEQVYAGQVIGENSRAGDMVINVCKSKKLTNMRASGADDKAKLTPPVKFSLEEALEYIQEDEFVELTPKSLRLRKILLDENARKRRKNAMSN